MPAVTGLGRLFACPSRTAAARCVGLAMFAAFLLLAGRAAADEFWVRLTWGGGDERMWHGTIAASDGSLAEPRPLGIEADEPGSMWIETDAAGSARLAVHQRSGRVYDGVDVLVSAPRSAKLIVQLAADDDREQPKSAKPAVLEIPLADLAADPINKELDRRGNRLFAQRTPGDLLRVRIDRDHLVFAPREVFKFTIEPSSLPATGDKARIKVQLLRAGREISSQQHDVAADRAKAIPVELALPAEEGVYDVAIAAVGNPDWSQAVRQPLNWNRTIADRRIQLLVLQSQKPAAPTGARERPRTQVVEIDPANPRWYERFNKLPQLQLAGARLPPLWKGRLGDDRLQTRRHALGELAELAPNNDSPDVSWEAYWLPIDRPGRPHVVEIDYPSDVPQTLNCCILEPNAAGAASSLTIESSLDVAAETPGDDAAPRWLHHRLIFWPRTATPLLLVANGRDRTPAVYGKIRVLSGDARLPPAAVEKPAADRRLLAAYLDRPLIAENFAADECLNAASGQSLHDWTTFHQGGSRLVEYLNHAGYNGLMLTVLADGGAIYPSEVVEPTSRYDTGVFFATGQDPIRKDVLEMLFRMFDREKLQLIPAIDFSSPLPELEAMRRAGGFKADGLEWIGADGASWCESWTPRRGLAPYYNVLDPRVQKAMLRVLREVATRYARHPAFTGLALRLSPDGYAQLPGPDWGLDDATIARFERDAHVRVPGGGARRYAAREAYLADPWNRRLWLEWRASELAKFHRLAADELAAIRPGSHLYLAGAAMLDGPELDAQLRPSLPRRGNVASAMLQVGVDARLYRDDARGIVLLRPETIAPQGEIGAIAADIEVGQMADIDRYFQGATAGCLFFHEPRRTRIESFEKKNPFKPGATWLVSQPTPSDRQNRRRFVHALATLDAQTLIDGGWTLSMGQEESLADWTAAYRALPAVEFQPVKGTNGEPSQPAMFRCATHAGHTYLYAVNDAPFAVTARLHLDASSTCRIEALGGQRKIEPLKPDESSGMTWQTRLGPYDLVAVRLSEANVACSNARVTWPDGVDAALSARIRQLGVRAASLRSPPPIDGLANPGFEQSAVEGTPIPGWDITARDKVRIELDKRQKHDGRQSVKIASSGPIACLVSRWLKAPPTGRLAVSMWLRTSDAARQPPLRLALQWSARGHDDYRFAPVGQSRAGGPEVTAILPEWGRYVFQVDDLPLDGVSAVRVRFDLMGAGEAWVDDVQIFNLAFNRAEMVELSKIIALADVKRQNGQIGDCMRLLDGYWPRFLEEHVPLPTDPSIETAAAKSAAKAHEKPPERSGLLNRVKDMLPDALRR